MLAVHLSARSGLSRCHAGETGAIYAVSSSLRTAHESEDVAIYHGGLWHSVSSAEAYDRLAIEQPCTLRFEQFVGDAEQSMSLGLFAGLVIANGVIKTTGHKPRLLAVFDDSLEQWRAVDDTVWPIVVIEEVAPTGVSAA